MPLNICIYQHHGSVANLTSNVEKISKAYLEAIKQFPQLDVFVVGEMAVSGYTPLDLVYNSNYLTQLQKSINHLINITKEQNTTLVFGDIWEDSTKVLYKVAYVVKNRVIVNIIRQQNLVDYDVFNESRYFNKGEGNNNIIEVKGYKLALLVGEDLGHEDVVLGCKNSDIIALISINASPYYKNKYLSRIDTAKKALSYLHVPIIYVNRVGGIDGLVFDGQSFILDKKGDILNTLPLAEEAKITFSVNKNSEVNQVITTPYLEFYTSPPVIPTLLAKGKSKYTEKVFNSPLQEFYEIIQVGFKDYINDNNFKGVIIGISGGMDSALSATLAVDTLGSESVIGVSMPSVFTSKLSKQIINEVGKNLNITIYEVPIDNIVQSYLNNKEFINTLLSTSLKVAKNSFLENSALSLMKENLQSRVRGNILMAISNKLPGYVLLSNGNKSELATGYFTLYGDSCGAFNLIKDLFKTEVYGLAKWRNSTLSKFSKLQKLNLIPDECINRKPTAELDYNQTDEESLLPYFLLDHILKNIIEDNYDFNQLLEKFTQKDINLVLKLLKNSEYKRKQGVMGIKLKNKSFGKEWQYPLTNRFQKYDNNN